MDENSRELQESINNLTATVNALISVQQATLTERQRAQINTDRDLNRFGESVRATTQATSNSTRATIDSETANRKYEKSMKDFGDSLKLAGSSVVSFMDQLSKQEGKFAGYGKTLDQAGGAVSKFLSAFGPLGVVAGAVVTGLTKVVKLQAEQADNLLKAQDQLSKLGTTGSFTTDQLRQMANDAGITSKNMHLLTNPIKGLGQSLVTLGGNAGDGAKNFAKLAKYSNEQLEMMQRLGVNQEQLIQSTADYVKLQTIGGRQLKGEMADKAQLQKAAMEYTQNLQIMAAITGKDVDKIKAQQEEHMNALNTQIKLAQLETLAKKAAAEGRGDEAAAYKKQAQALRDTVAAIGAAPKPLAEAVREMQTTGTITSKNAQMMQRIGMGPAMQEYVRNVKSGANAQKEMEKLMKLYYEKFGENVLKTGTAAAIAGGELAETLVGGKEAMQDYNQSMNVNQKEEGDLARKRIEQAKKPGFDPTRDAQAKMATAERSFATMVDEMVAAGNPLLKGFNTGTLAIMALQAAAIAAATALGALAAGKFAGGLKDAAGMVFGRGRGAGAASSAAGGMTTMWNRRQGRNVEVTQSHADRRAQRLERLAQADAAGRRAGEGMPRGQARMNAERAAMNESLRGSRNAPVPTARPAAPAAGGGGGGGMDIGGSLETLGNLGESGVLKGLAEGLKAFANPMILKGAAIFAASATMIITGIGAGIAAASWLMGKALPTLIEGMKGFEDLDGEKLKSAGVGMAALGGGLAVFGVGGVAASFGSVASSLAEGLTGLFGGKTPFEKLKEFSELDIDGEKVKKNAEALVAFSGAMAKAGASFGVEGIGSFISNVSDGIGRLTGGKAIVQKLADFSEMTIDHEKVKQNAESLVVFGDAMAKFSGGKSALNSIANTVGSLADGVNKLTGGKSINQKLVEFSEIKLDPERVKVNAEALKAFSEAIGTTKVSSGFGKLLGSLGDAFASFTKSDILSKFKDFLKEKIGDPKEAKDKADALKSFVEALSGGNISASQGLGKIAESYSGFMDKIFRNKTPIEKFKEFVDLPINPGKAKDNAQAFKEFVTAMGMWGSIGSGPGGAAGGAPEGAAPGGAAAGAAPGGAAAPSGGYTAPPMTQDVKQNLEAIKAAMKEKGFTNENYLNAVVGTVMKESGGKMVNENMDYSKTSNERIRKIFGSRVSNMSEEQLNQVKSGGAESFSNAMYGGEWGKKHLGNTEPGDGWKYRGRGFIGLTGRSNYADASKKIYGDDRLVKDPDLVNKPEVAAQIVAYFFQKNSPRMAQITGIDPGKASFEDAVKHAVSVVAGKKVTKGEGFIGTEGIGKAEAFGKQYASGTLPMATAAATPSAGGGGAAPPAGAGPSTTASGPPAQPQSKPESHAVGSGSPGDTKPKLTSVSTKSGKTAMVKDEYAPRFQALLDYLDSVGYNIYSLGGYVDRDVTNRPGVKSIHAYGAAIDINPKTNPYGSTLVTDMPEGIQQVAAKLGLGWGGAWDTPKDAMHFSAAAREGGTVKLSEGGIAVGPNTGYPAELHGREMVVPLDENSILKKLATTPDSATDVLPKIKEMFTNSIPAGEGRSGEMMRQLMESHQTMIQMLADKLDTIRYELETSNSTQDKILKYSKA